MCRLFVHKLEVKVADVSLWGVRLQDLGTWGGVGY